MGGAFGMPHAKMASGDEFDVAFCIRAKAGARRGGSAAGQCTNLRKSNGDNAEIESGRRGKCARRAAALRV